MDLHSNKVILTKALTWKILSTLTTGIIAYVILGDMAIAGEIAAVEFVVKAALYYFHEKGWIGLSNHVKAKNDRKTMGREIPSDED